MAEDFKLLGWDHLEAGEYKDPVPTQPAQRRLFLVLNVRFSDAFLSAALMRILNASFMRLLNASFMRPLNASLKRLFLVLNVRFSGLFLNAY